MKRIIMMCGIAAAAIQLSSCSTEAPYADYVDIKGEIIQVGSGFIEMKFTPEVATWYLAGAVEADPDANPMSAKNHFMALAVDAAYRDYIDWRHEKLIDKTPHIAPFASHALQYGEVNKHFTYLKPDTDYWVYWFVVNPETDKPAGKLNLRTIHTGPKSFIDINYEYRVKGQWDYIYPRDHQNNIVTNVPWVGFTRDSVVMRLGDAQSCHEYFNNLYELHRKSQSANIFYGIYAHNNNGIGDGTTDTKFEEGHTYYTALATFDGKMSDVEIYKFKWSGNDANFYFTPKDKVTEDW